MSSSLLNRSLIRASSILIYIYINPTVKGVPLTRDNCDSLQILVLADWGGSPHAPYTTSMQIDVANQMATTAGERNISFVLSLGDNFYDTGIYSWKSDRFETTFENVYNQESLQIPWYIIAGNHDHYGSVRAQIRRSSSSFRWMFPHFYYKQSWMLPDDKVLDVLLIDTTILCGNTYDTPYGKRLKGPKNVHNANLQWSWLERTLKESKSDFLLVGGHYPVYSVGVNGPTECLYSRLEPLLYKYHVTAYLSGHDHNLQHIQTRTSGQKMDYFVLGSGSWTDDLMTNQDTVPKESLKFFFAKKHIGGFALVDVTEKRLKISFVASNGDVKYNYNLDPRK
ncbi:tartrate-resistant acid phosphatase type 5-like [Ruditapes philippinarum]|uniref:tartrate-resistant acid phosphatase type 5-like n=1 Tax=Ruditapes philippinarum TaxID=129788 RepID=UPI00295BF26E|nr:tartrate-resistant acid phosphatase type 5-like [Ruditapes philippinarum]